MSDTPIQEGDLVLLCEHTLLGHVGVHCELSHEVTVEVQGVEVEARHLSVCNLCALALERRALRLSEVIRAVVVWRADFTYTPVARDAGRKLAEQVARGELD